MNYIEQMVAELCPNGVEFKTVADTVEVVPTARGVQRQDYASGSRFPIVDQGQSFIAGYTDDESVVVDNGEYVIFGDHTRSVKWVDFAFAPGADGTKVLRAVGTILPKFLYYAIANLDIQSRGYNRHWTILRDLRIPAPPLPIQQEIVRVLDLFMALLANLQAELVARRKQYQYYRDQLLSFEGRKDVRWGTLGEICHSLEKGTLKTGQLLADGLYPVINSGRDWYGRYDKHNNDGNAITIASRGEYAGFINYIGEKFWAGGLCYPYRSKDEVLATTKYIFYALKRSERSIMDTLVSRGGIPALNKTDIDKFRIPIPPLEVQEEIVTILDKFDALVNDLCIGLPAEIAARQKQYEYYRDRLLTFPEAG